MPSSPPTNELKKRSNANYSQTNDHEDISHNQSNISKKVPNSRISVELNDDVDQEFLPLTTIDVNGNNNGNILTTAYPSLWLVFTTAMWSAAAYSFILSPIVTHIMGASSKPVQSSQHSEYDLALSQSYGFFTDLPTFDWKLMQERVKERKNHWDMNNPTLYMDNPPAWYQNNYEPDFTCPHERRVGGLGDGPKWVCDPHRILPYSTQRKEHGGNGCLVYSVGSQGNFDFEIGLMETLSQNQYRNVDKSGKSAMDTKSKAPCEIHIFDPQDYSGKAPEGIHYHAWGIKSSTDDANDAKTNRKEEGQEYKTFQETVATLGHQKRVIDVFKIDCEGCEWETYKDWFTSQVTMMQILVEVHKSPPQAIDFFDTMQQKGYVTFHKEPNTIFGGGNCQEYAMLKLAPNFFESIE